MMAYYPLFLLSVFLLSLTISQQPTVAVAQPGKVKTESVDTSDLFLKSELESMVKLKLISNKQKEKLSEILKSVEVEYLDTNSVRQKGWLITHKDVAQTISKIFKQLADSGFVIERIEPMSKYKWSDSSSMANNNTSCFNYRLVSGTRSISKHANGLAIDINPFWNPFVSGKHISPKGAKYDIKRPGTIHKKSFIYKIFKENGWTWGGEWIPYQDYQHFFYDKIKVKSC